MIYANEKIGLFWSVNVPKAAVEELPDDVFAGFFEGMLKCARYGAEMPAAFAEFMDSEYVRRRRLTEKCECGAHKTYGSKRGDPAHAVYCPWRR